MAIQIDLNIRPDIIDMLKCHIHEAKLAVDVLIQDGPILVSISIWRRHLAYVPPKHNSRQYKPEENLCMYMTESVKMVVRGSKKSTAAMRASFSSSHPWRVRVKSSSWRCILCNMSAVRLSLSNDRYDS